MCIILGVIKQGEAQHFSALLLRRHSDGHFLPFYTLINALYKYSAYKVFIVL